MAEENELVKTLRELANLGQQVEHAKIDLAKQIDFNLHDCFHIVDSTGKAWVTASELKTAINSSGVPCDYDDASLITKRYDRNNDGRLDFAEFSRAFTPLDPTYAHTLARRNPNYVKEIYKRDEVFLFETRQLLRNCWKIHIHVEQGIEAIRQSLYKRSCFNIHDAFLLIDVNANGRISADEFGYLLNANGFHISQTELQVLTDVFDTNQDLTVSYAEFSDELTPKLGINHDPLNYRF